MTNKLEGHKLDCSRTTVIGHEVRGWYDGIAYWQCHECGTIWDRGAVQHNDTTTVPHPVMGDSKLLGSFKE